MRTQARWLTILVSVASCGPLVPSHPVPLDPDLPVSDPRTSVLEIINTKVGGCHTNTRGDTVCSFFESVSVDAIDGEFPGVCGLFGCWFGRIPYSQVMLSPGTYTLTLKLSGYQLLQPRTAFEPGVAGVAETRKGAPLLITCTIPEASECSVGWKVKRSKGWWSAWCICEPRDPELRREERARRRKESASGATESIEEYTDRMLEDELEMLR